MNNPQQPNPPTQPQRQPLPQREPEWMRRRRVDGLKAKDMTSTVLG